MQELIDILKRRIDPTGTREVTIREYGQAIEIIIPNTGQDALDFVKRRITRDGPARVPHHGRPHAAQFSGT